MIRVALVPILLLAFAGASSCSAAPGPSEEPSAPKSWEPECVSATDARGAWTELPQPEEITGYSELNALNVFSDGETFSLFQNNSFFSVAQLGPGDQDWTVESTDRNIEISGGVWSASPEYLLIQGGANTGLVDRGETTNAVELLDLSSLTWSKVIPPDDVVLSVIPALAAHTGSEFIFWGSYAAASDGSTTSAFYSHAVLFDPQSRAWRRVESPLAPFGYNAGELPLPLSGQLSADLGASGLFAWGILPDAITEFGLLFETQTEQWILLSDGGPSARRFHDVVAAPTEMYLVGGVHIDSDISSPAYLGEIWRYSLADEEWTELDVPDFVDPMQGVWLDDKLYVIGRCDSDAVYDPAADTWEALPPLPIPGVGVAHGAGGRLFISQVYGEHGDDVLSVFIYDPDGSNGAGGAGSE